MKLWHHALSENDIRQCLRIATGTALGFTLSKFFNWNYGVFYTITPILLMGLVPKLDIDSVRQCIGSALLCSVEVGILTSFFSVHPVLMSLIAFFIFLCKFICMSKGSLFLFGANSVMNLSIMLHFSSFPTTDLNELIFSNIWGSLLSVVIALLMMTLIPDTENRATHATQPKQSHRMRHESLMGALIATLSFWIFQCLNLHDSISAQATTLLLLFPMHWNGALGYARRRIIGTLLGVSISLVGQLFLYNWSGELILVVPSLWIGLMLFSYVHVKEGQGSGVGFAALATLGILLGQNFTPGNDLIFTALYRMSSVLFAIVATLISCYLVHRLLNSFDATRFSD